MNDKKQKSPLKIFGAIGSALGFAAGNAGLMGLNPALAGGLLVGGTLLAANKARKDKKNLRSKQAAFEERMDQYEQMEFQPINTDSLQRENIFEDMEINTEAFEASRRSFQQSQANILQGLRGVAGSSGAAGLAQVLSMQAADQSEQLRLTVSEQLMRNKELRLQEESRMNDQMMQIELANQEGARQFEMDKLTTLMGVEGQKVAGARQSIANRQSMYGSMAGGIGSIIGAGIN